LQRAGLFEKRLQVRERAADSACHMMPLKYSKRETKSIVYFGKFPPNGNSLSDLRLGFACASGNSRA
jgi:hypothetical protein